MNFKINDFEGPLDLLLHLVKKNKMDIFDVQVLEITNQYLQIISESNLDVASEFLVMATELLKLKSKLLIPNHNHEPSEETIDLSGLLIEYELYKNISCELSSRQKLLISEYENKPMMSETIIDNRLLDLTLSNLTHLNKHFNSASDDKIIANKKIEKITATKKIPIHVKIRQIISNFSAKISMKLSEFFSGQRKRDEIVVTFLAILELVKLGKISINNDIVSRSVELE